MKTFREEKIEIIQGIESLLKQYENFTKSVSPKHWRTTGTHYTNLKQMQEDLVTMTEMTQKEKEIPWVKNELNR